MIQRLLILGTFLIGVAVGTAMALAWMQGAVGRLTRERDDLKGRVEKLERRQAGR